MSDEIESMRDIIKSNDYTKKETVFECVINKSATILVTAKNKEHAYIEACAVLDGKKGWSEYTQDGWEVVPELIEKQTEDV